jgi:serine O-acetyltransferase
MGIISQIRDDFRFYREIKPTQGFFAVALDRCFWVVANYRFGYWACRLRTPIVSRVIRLGYVLCNFFVSAINGTDIRSGAVIGRRFDVHTSHGIVIADGVVIGDNCTINSGVCLINKANGKGEGVPRLGDHVKLGAGCKVMGGIIVGDHVHVGVNSVVIRDVPAHHIAIGLPAMNIPSRRGQQVYELENADELFVAD